MTRSWAIEAKFDGSTWTDISSYVRQVSVRRGRATDLDVVEPGVLNIELDNQDGRFTPENTQGAYSPDVKPGVPVRVSVTGGAASTTYRLFTGEVQRWEPVWTVGGLPLVMLEAVDGFEKLERFEIDWPYSVETRDNNPAAYWSTLREMQGQTSLNLTVETTNTGDTTDDGDAIVSGAPGSLKITGADPAPTFADEFGGAATYGAPTSWMGTSNDITFSAVVQFEESALLDYGWTIAECRRGAERLGPGQGYWRFYLNGPGDLIFAVKDSGSSVETVSTPGVTSWTAGRAYHVAVWWDQSTKTVKIYRDGVELVSDTVTTVPSGSGDVTFRVGIPGGGDPNVWLLSDCSLWTSDQSAILPTLSSAVGGFASDSPSERIGRVLDWAGWDGAARDIDTGTTSLAAVSAGTALSACQDAAAADGGVFYISKAGDATFQGRRGRWEDAAGTEYVDEYSDTYGTVGGAVFEFDDDGTDSRYQAVGWRYDTTLLQNRVVVNSDTQGVSDGLAEDSTSQGSFGTRTLTVSTISNDTDDNAERAVWELSRRKDPHLRVEEVRTLVADADREDVAGMVELQDRVDVNRRPGAGQDDITAEMRVADLSHEISEGGARWELTVGLLDASTDQPGIYGEAVYGTDYYGY